ncbi:MAG: enoyl-CoA hydratase/isomerase family protein, partial [Betaproteobacteria bacterium]|nr:enoyl-CoA hydratase/isomerase family protein [Betaproteobacteria bacterium]
RVFNLGGDLALFVLFIKARDREALAHYARLCIDNMHARMRGYDAPLVTVSLVQGDALGGGLECALSSDVVFAEESAALGLPEILFNLFPGMGAVSLLSRRLGARAAESLVLSGRVLGAQELHRLGVVDVLVKEGEGEEAVRRWIAAHERRRNGTAAFYAARRAVQAVPRAELDAVAQTWVDAALRLEDRDLKMMGRIVRSQMRRLERGDVADVALDAMAQSEREEAPCARSA